MQHPWLSFSLAGVLLGVGFYLNIIRYRSRLSVGIYLASSIVVTLMLVLPYLPFR